MSQYSILVMLIFSISALFFFIFVYCFFILTFRPKKSLGIFVHLVPLLTLTPFAYEIEDRPIYWRGLRFGLGSIIPTLLFILLVEAR